MRFALHLHLYDLPLRPSVPTTPASASQITALSTGQLSNSAPGRAAQASGTTVVSPCVLNCLTSTANATESKSPCIPFPRLFFKVISCRGSLSTTPGSTWSLFAPNGAIGSVVV
ncbi:hypothetical protein B0H14DRAFT_3476744 [Mycena olivaceomarginata]|nr:hypothetical protein B0H14DRAFT_3476744 [Mycena olivaceomarginata]